MGDYDCCICAISDMNATLMSKLLQVLFLTDECKNIFIDTQMYLESTQNRLGLHQEEFPCDSGLGNEEHPLLTGCGGGAECFYYGA